MHAMGICGCEAAPPAKRTRARRKQAAAPAAAPAPAPDVALPVPVLEHERVTVLHGDSLRLLEVIAPGTVDSVVADGPAGIGFMGEQWDDYRRAANTNDAGRDNAFGRLSRSGPEYGRDEAGFIAAMTPIFAAAFAALKPGGHGVFWAIPRTSDWTMRALRAAGFEIRDQIHDLLAADELLQAFLESLDDEQRLAFLRLVESQASPLLYWVYGQGMPKSKAHLKPAVEHWILVRKPVVGSAKKNTVELGTGLLQIDEARIGTSDNLNGGAYSGGGRPSSLAGHTGQAGGRGSMFEAGGGRLDPGAFVQPSGRWPANLTLAHSSSCEPERDGGTCAPGCPVAEFDAQSGATGARAPVRGTEPSAAVEVGGVTNPRRRVPGAFHVDSGGASRFFFTAKPPASEKRAGLADTTAKHPTVKPLALMRWLVRLVTPPGGLVLDPFAGSGTTLLAALEEGRRAIGIERESKYLPILLGRVKHTISGMAPATDCVAAG